ncbi:hypothetical protein YOLOSWAG_124 [Erwinia phage vB_EamM_Yoloswag]|uniref:Transcriptional coactivator p15 (PC4) C-terminal domain-containing protein n=1 Tax=Erwinia phage vB_EamM_Yoloswag TaxID=1958956 RepID=A0A1S6L344_9CAUD|nr:hypothetical protein HOR66_gp124 [Erwinia phage vB_EamM_Yoloswag]AQT28605.1 hypothetical protein YOLOSWAG_124 [Erwinia phage vB_EamM_Yoloswag]
MVMKNGKIIIKRKRDAETEVKKKKSSKPVEVVADKPKKKKAKAEPEKKKKTRQETSEPAAGYIRLGEHSFLTVELAEDDRGKSIVAIRKFYSTKNDPEKKPARGGFNMEPSSSELKILAGLLRQIAKEIDEGK